MWYFFMCLLICVCMNFLAALLVLVIIFMTSLFFYLLSDILLYLSHQIPFLHDLLPLSSFRLYCFSFFFTSYEFEPNILPMYLPFFFGVFTPKKCLKPFSVGTFNPILSTSFYTLKYQTLFNESPDNCLLFP